MKLKHMCNAYNTTGEYFSVLQHSEVLYGVLLEYFTALLNILVFYCTVEYLMFRYYSILQYCSVL